jgi:hypothetical protein
MLWNEPKQPSWFPLEGIIRNHRHDGRTARCTGRVVEAISEAGATTAVAGLHHEADSDEAFVRPPCLERDQLDLSAAPPGTGI